VYGTQTKIGGTGYFGASLESQCDIFATVKGQGQGVTFLPQSRVFFTFPQEKKVLQKYHSQGLFLIIHNKKSVTFLPHSLLFW
jgi:hypothetical protein